MFSYDLISDFEGCKERDSLLCLTLGSLVVRALGWAVRDSGLCLLYLIQSNLG